ncbi:MAG: ATP-binding protein [Vicinamibacterales bacterium]|nr:ATP-binding protein [Vicinamibacterales bacterium]
MVTPTPRGRRPELRRTLRSSLDEVDPVCHDVRAFLRDHDETGAGFVVELVARECINNAVLHGNRQDPAKLVTIAVCIGRRYFCLRVSDQGTGFDWRERLALPVPGDTAVRGRGLPILEMYARKLAFNQAGTCVTVWLTRTCGEG